MSLIQPALLKPPADALRSGERLLIEAVDEAVARLDAIDPQIQAFLPEPGRRERLYGDILALQARFPDKHPEPALYGELVGIKDIFHADGFEIRAGSSLPPELLKGTEAAVVTRLKAAGALILGKTVTAEFAFIEPGATRNPHNLDHTPGGSSSGSAAAVAAGLCPLAIGTQTIGSVIRPAAYCGIVGFKPSFGRISTVGVIPVSASLDHVGLFTQDVEGMALAASIAFEEWDWQIRDQKTDLPILGVPDGAYLAQAGAEAHFYFEGQVIRLEKAGFQVKRVRVLENIEMINQRARRIMAAEAAQVHAEWFAAYESLYRPRTAGLIREGQGIDAELVAAAQRSQIVTRERLESTMHAEGIDLWISPAATGTAPKGIDSTGDSAMNLPWTFTGLPTLTLPAGKADNGLPVGLQVSGTFGSDEQLLAWAQWLEAELA